MTSKTPLFLAEIESYSHDGRGIAIVNGKTTFVSGAIQGEQVTCYLTKKHNRYNEASTVDVIRASPERALPACAHFGICGGCSLQHMEMDTQIQLKLNTLLEQLKHFGKVTPLSVLPPINASTFGYRRKARLGVRFVRKKGRVLVGFREKFSHFLTDIHSCPVLHPSIGQSIGALSELIASLSQHEHIPQIEVAVSDQASVLIFRHLTPLTEQDLAALKQFGEIHQLHIYLQPNPPEKVHRIWPLSAPDKLSYSLDTYSIEMQFGPLDFIQVNAEVNHLLVKQAITLLDPQPRDNILDLFCGLGNFTLPLARFAHHVTGIEGSGEMVKLAKENAQHNQIDNTDFFMENLMDPKPSSPWIQQVYDKILLDPPRTGAKEILPFFAGFSAKKVVYVSCNPATLARDAGELVHTHGYQLKEVGVINMFPHTSHIETIAHFEK